MKNLGKSDFFLTEKIAYDNFIFFNFRFALRSSHGQNRGFTIIELLVVTAIIALIASSVFVLFSQARAKGRDVTREQHIKTLQTALDSYYTNARSYPVCDPGQFITGTDCVSVPLINADAFSAAPHDPLDQGNYRYFYESADGAAYSITYYLETNDIPGKPQGQNQATP